ncbi:hypothetical protein NPIL_145391 [Nephila pilipes]|uniref:Uncharacterized protein n=1 Tax=Nephila pilipes TaxID=299642 RepID=A0A8X6P0N3_NEPPI|nr:hypothetical protein NPIL_145391 [Nephila pilipes]
MDIDKDDASIPSLEEAKSNTVPEYYLSRMMKGKWRTCGLVSTFTGTKPTKLHLVGHMKALVNESPVDILDDDFAVRI